jgi:hypothetical protein
MTNTTHPEPYYYLYDMFLKPKSLPWLISLPLAFASASPASAINIVRYDLAGAAGNQLSQAPASTASNITGLNITRGAGLTRTAATDSFNSAGFEGTAAAPSSNEYVEFGFTVDAGYTVNLNNLKIGTRSSNTGPGTIGLFSSVDGFGSALISITLQSGATTNLLTTIDLSNLVNLTGTIGFRFYEIGNTAANGGVTGATGTFRLANFDSNGIVLDGQVTPVVAVPFEFSPTFGLVMMGAWMSRKWLGRKIQTLRK